MQKVIFLKGLPGSGKSTWAKQQLDENPGVYKRINKDDLRAMFDNGEWSKKNEEFILKTRDKMVHWALQDGYSVIVDDTNFSPRHERRIKEIAAGVPVEVKFFDTPIEECIARDLKRANSVGEAVIRKMYNENLRTTPEPLEDDPRLPNAIICDIDGTLAKMDGRGPFDWDRVGEDKLNTKIAVIVQNYQALGSKIIIVSGRDGICREQTEAWLAQNKIYYDELHMRPVGNTEKDDIIKLRIYQEHISGKYNVSFVLDDRNKVVAMWRRIGLTCLQVAEGDF